MTESEREVEKKERERDEGDQITFLRTLRSLNPYHLTTERERAFVKERVE